MGRAKVKVPTIKMCDDGPLDFDATYAAIANSVAYREAANELTRVLPQWVVPYSEMTPEDAYRFTAIPFGDDETMLDVGCGLGGPGLWICGNSRLIGIDSSVAAVAAATELAARLGKSARAEFKVAQAQSTGLPDASVAVAISIDALMFMPAADVVREMARVLRSRGFFAFIASEWISEEAPPLPTVERDYSSILEAAGFHVLEHMKLDPHRGLPLFRALLSREAALRAQIGKPAERLIEEARAALANADKAPRVQPAFIIARRP
jgi:SAM-dependent methyltransferase